MKIHAAIVTLAACAAAVLGTPVAQAQLAVGNGVFAPSHYSSSNHHAKAKAKSIGRVGRSLPSYPRRGFEPTS